MSSGGGITPHCFFVATATSLWIKMNAWVLLGTIFFAYNAHAQLYGPVPPRPQEFPGAIALQPARSNFRQRAGTPRTAPELIQPVQPAPATRSRRPQPLRKVKPQFPQQQVLDQQRTNLIEDGTNSFQKLGGPTPLPQFQQSTTNLTPRPVEEEVNEEVGTTIVTQPTPTTYAGPRYPPVPAPAPAPLQPQGFQRAQFAQPSAYRIPGAQPVQQIQAVQPAQYPEAALQGRQLIRQQPRPAQPASRQPLQPQVVAPQVPVVQESVPEEEQYFRQVQTRPLKKQEPVRQQIVDPQPIRQQLVRQPENLRQQEYVRQVQREPHVKAPTREKKPVVQTIRKYHEEHEDGSITWGYENDDGSFKEETIGIDCVTRGKYGYVDPDGVKREYTYQTGIPCDKAAQEAEEAASNHGFIDYTNNKYVLPNGDEIDLEAMVKNRARKPVPQYRI